MRRLYPGLSLSLRSISSPAIADSRLLSVLRQARDKQAWEGEEKERIIERGANAVRRISTRDRIYSVFRSTSLQTRSAAPHRSQRPSLPLPALESDRKISGGVRSCALIQLANPFSLLLFCFFISLSLLSIYLHAPLLSSLCFVSQKRRCNTHPNEFESRQ